jgi:hypothetical protein
MSLRTLLPLFAAVSVASACAAKPAEDDSGAVDDTGVEGVEAPEAQVCGAVECAEDEACVDGTCVGAGELRFTLTWSEVGDLDLYVVTPSGATIDYTTPSADGGELDLDNRTGGEGSVENVFFSEADAGTYQYSVNHFEGSTEPISFTVSVVAGDTEIASQSGSLTSGEESDIWTLDF